MSCNHSSRSIEICLDPDGQRDRITLTFRCRGCGVKREFAGGLSTIEHEIGKRFEHGMDELVRLLAGSVHILREQAAIEAQKASGSVVR